ncbi:MAG: hypothetical protein RIT24_3184 [Planctomycetota bacterium]|jgi:hypothetical protein
MSEQLSPEEYIAVATPLISAAFTLRLAPDANREDLARAANGISFSANMLAWLNFNREAVPQIQRIMDAARSEEAAEANVTGPLEIAEVACVPQYAGAVQLVAVSAETRSTSLSGETWELPEALAAGEDAVALRDHMRALCLEVYSAVLGDSSLALAAKVLRDEAKRLLSLCDALGIERPKLQQVSPARDWWVADIARDEWKAVRAKKNALNAAWRLASLRLQLEKTEKERSRATEAPGLVRGATTVMRTMHQAMVPQAVEQGARVQWIGTFERKADGRRRKTNVVQMFDRWEVETPKGVTAHFDFDAQFRPGNTSLASLLTPNDFKVFLATHMRAYDQGNPDLSFDFPIEECARLYWGKADKRTLQHVSNGLARLMSTRIVGAGTWRAEDGKGQALIECVTDGRRRVYGMPQVVRAALGMYDTGNREQLKAMAGRPDMVQFPRAAMGVQAQSFPMVIGGALLLRDSVRKWHAKGRLVIPTDYFLRRIGRFEHAKRGSFATELRNASQVLTRAELFAVDGTKDEVEIIPTPIMRDGYEGLVRAQKSHAAKGAKGKRSSG